ncbi:MAG: UDP-N-acetylglucosamine 1-carboxyvinyltransferase [Lachnospiraceae bacterium]|nr:UDP-N-acetylglucosamine 1-carboxyvinyltransferase [Lachnospiraceae bacterium]
MECVEIIGGKPLSGRIEIQGSKNAVLPVLAGCVLHAGISRIRHCPRLQDVEDMIAILRELGCLVWWEEDCLTVDASFLSGTVLPKETAGRMRSSIFFLGALLGRCGQADIPYPGGCVIGARPVDFHVEAMRSMGAGIDEAEGRIAARAKSLRGVEITLKLPSVGATENIILAAVLAEGVTVINNGAKEPEIEELCRFLRGKGARIRLLPQGSLEITGVSALKDSEHELIADRIAAGTYLLAAAVTNGVVTLGRMPVQHMQALLDCLEKMNIAIKKEGKDITVDCRKPRRGIEFLETAPYPGFPTDLQSPMMTLLAVTEGRCRLRENVFEARFKTVEQLRAMGAQITTEGREAIILGVPGLHGAQVRAEELRGAAALFLAGLGAEGRTQISGCGFISRGYENICENLKQLGADISVEE